MQQSAGTKETTEALTQLLNYTALNPEATVCYTASDMILAIESDASYCTYLSPKHAPVQLATFSSPINVPPTTKQTLPMAPSMYFAKSCAKCYRVPLKPKFAPTSTTAKKLAHFVLHS
jgi:hypothetical protein